jgi:hypothetical protein
MSDTPTPRTDGIRQTIAIGDFIRPEIDGVRLALDHSEQLEREVSAANNERDNALAMLGVYKLGCDQQKERIRRLVEAGDAMAQQFMHPTVDTHNWTQAKEAKP